MVADIILCTSMAVYVVIGLNLWPEKVRQLEILVD